MPQPPDFEPYQPEDQAEADSIAESLALLDSGQEIYWEWFDIIAQRSTFQGPRRPLVLIPVASHEDPAIARSNQPQNLAHSHIDPNASAEEPSTQPAVPPRED